MALYKLPNLSDSMIDDISFAMENQEMDAAFSLSKAFVLDKLHNDNHYKPEDLVDLPDWTSRDGFSLMREYAENCPNTKVKKILCKELDSHQKGVFRRFKDCLSQYPELLSQWYSFKQFRMAKVIRQWYKALGGEINQAPELFDFDLSKSHAQLLGSISIEQGFGPFEKEINELCDFQDDGLIKFCSSLENQNVLICYDSDNQLAGFVKYSLLDSSNALVYYFYVESLKRRQGLFSLLMEHLSLYLGSGVKIHLCFKQELKDMVSKYASLEGSQTTTIVSYAPQSSVVDDELEAGSYYL